MVGRSSMEIKAGERKQQVERELSNFMKRENEFRAQERHERAARTRQIQPSRRRHELTARTEENLSVGTNVEAKSARAEGNNSTISRLCTLGLGNLGDILWQTATTLRASSQARNNARHYAATP